MTLISRCPWCGKASHPTKATALRSARRRRDRRAPRTVRLRAYRCPAGQGWHLTSRRPRRRPPSQRPGTVSPDR